MAVLVTTSTAAVYEEIYPSGWMWEEGGGGAEETDLEDSRRMVQGLA